MKLEFFNCPEPEQMDASKLPDKPEFVTHEPDFHLLEHYARGYSQYKNILIIANGGSINPFYGLYYALKHQAKKKSYFLTTQDPDYIHELKQELKPEDTLVLSISKSGENTQQIEETVQFASYPLLFVTGKSSPLRAMGEKMGAKIINHPPIGGRYTGLTEVSLLAAALCGLDVKGLYKGGKKMYELYNKDNLAFRAASVYWQLEQQGFVDVLMFFYSHALFPSSAPIVQLCHESFGKEGKGQTYVAHEGPEVQHHTTQRYYGGPKNMSGFFVTPDSFLHPTMNAFPTATHSVQMKGHHLHNIDQIPLEKAIEYEWTGNIENSRVKGIPVAHLSLAGFSAEEIGSFTAFWQLYAVYSAHLRNVDPFDQPQVEDSKVISFNKRLQYKGLL